MELHGGANSYNKATRTADFVPNVLPGVVFGGDVDRQKHDRGTDCWSPQSTDHQKNRISLEKSNIHITHPKLNHYNKTPRLALSAACGVLGHPIFFLLSITSFVGLFGSTESSLPISASSQRSSFSRRALSTGDTKTRGVYLPSFIGSSSEDTWTSAAEGSAVTIESSNQQLARQVSNTHCRHKCLPLPATGKSNIGVIGSPDRIVRIFFLGEASRSPSL